jgi:hypothetical protein
MYYLKGRFTGLKNLRNIIGDVTKGFINGNLDKDKIEPFCSLADRLIKIMELEEKEAQDDNE